MTRSFPTVDSLSDNVSDCVVVDADVEAEAEFGVEEGAFGSAAEELLPLAKGTTGNSIGNPPNVPNVGFGILPGLAETLSDAGT